MTEVHGPSARTWFARACFVLVLAVVAGLLGVTHVERLCDHAGHYLVPVVVPVDVPAPRPRHTVVVVVDGLGLAHAQRFRALERLRAHGQCRRMRAGPITLSRPMYAVLSTGLEQDRTGCRANEHSSPLAAESIWQVARRSGLRVSSHTALTWWSELFPDGFDHSVVEPEESNFFARARLADLTLIHPLYVDHAGHEAGAGSTLYAEAAARADREIATLLERLDLDKDAVVFTADHGHREHGGHGGQQPEVAEVLTCFAGRGVARRSDFGQLAPTSVAPALALLLGVPFPRHMRAGEDELDAVLELLDGSVFSRSHLAARSRAVTRFRQANHAQLAQWSNPSQPATWSALYDSETRARAVRRSAVMCALGALMIVHWRRRRSSWRAALGFVVWACSVVAATLAFYVLVSGSLDLTSINGRWRFVGAGLTGTLAVAIGALLLHDAMFRDRRHLAEHWFCLSALVAGLAVLEPFVSGWRLGFPVPHPTALFLPLFAPIFLTVHALVSCELCVREIRRWSAIR